LFTGKRAGTLKNQGRAHKHLKPVAVVVAVVKPEKN
jgi:hypothetical protein